MAQTFDERVATFTAELATWTLSDLRRLATRSRLDYRSKATTREALTASLAFAAASVHHRSGATIRDSVRSAAARRAVEVAS